MHAMKCCKQGREREGHTRIMDIASDNTIPIYTLENHSTTITNNISLQDLLDNGVEIELMHIGSRFDVSKFYQVLYVYLEWPLCNRPYSCSYDITQFEAILFCSGGCDWR